MSLTDVIERSIGNSNSDVANAALQRILQAATIAINARGTFSLVLSGGNTPKLLYEKLAQHTIDFSKWHIFLADERCLPVQHQERNSRLVAIFGTQLNDKKVHYIPAERGAKTAAKQYANTLKPFLPFDMVLLGMGEDGHTASLFPGLFNASDTALCIAVHNAPKPPSDRVSLTPFCLSQNRQCLFLITGKGKQKALQAWQQKQKIPAALITSPQTIVQLLSSDVVNLDQS